jgi:hypothetical protein
LAFANSVSRLSRIAAVRRQGQLRCSFVTACLFFLSAARRQATPIKQLQSDECFMFFIPVFASVRKNERDILAPVGLLLLFDSVL